MAFTFTWAECDAVPAEVAPPPSLRKYWSRRGIAEWLVERLSEGVPTLVGIDHGFSFPLRYFEVHGLTYAPGDGRLAEVSCRVKS